MKRNWIYIVLSVWLFMLPMLAEAQNATFPTTAQYTSPALTSATTATGTPYNVAGYPGTGPNDLHFWTMSWWAVGTVSACQVKLEKSVDNVTYTDLIANQTCTSTGETSSATAGDTNYVRLNLGTKTGSGTVLVIFRGWNMNPYGTVNVNAGGSGAEAVNLTQVNGNTVLAGNGATGTGSPRVTISSDNTAIPITANATYPTAYNPGVTAVTSGSTATVTSTTTLLQSMMINNQANAAVTVTVTDGNNAYLVGPTFSMPALSSLVLNFPAGVLMTSGIKASASAAGSINIYVGGKQ